MDKEGRILGGKGGQEGDWKERRQNEAQELIFTEYILSANDFPVHEYVLLLLSFEK